MPKLRIRDPRLFVWLLAGVSTLSLVSNPNQPTARAGTPFVETVQLQPILTTGLSSPVYVTNAHDGSNRLFIVELSGNVRLLEPGQTSPTTFLDITSKVLAGGEQGLLGLAFHPQFPTNGRFFVDYTRKPDGATVIAEFHVSPTNANIADTTERVILTIAQPFENHNGGMIEFGNDGFLYIALGDGGSGNDPGNRAQNVDELLGKILRINIDLPNGSVPYSSPPDNPFFGTISGRDEIYSYGLRNPFRFSFDRGTAQLYAGDVGQGEGEEVDIITRGSNCGWRVYEGNHCTGLDPTLCNPNGYAFPIAEYGHTAGRCSIIGGYVYRGHIATLPTGAYVYGDFCTGEIFVLQSATQSVLLDTSLNIASFGEDEAGEIYVVGIGGTVHRIVNPSASCTFFVSPLSRSLPGGDAAASVVVTAPLNCNWTAVSNDSFINITAGSSGTGTGAVTLSVESNPGGVRTGTMTVAGQIVTVTQSNKETLFDFDGDSEIDTAVWHPGDGTWYIINSSNGSTRVVQWGASGQPFNIPLAGDYDGDGNADIAVWHPGDGTWYIINSSDASTRIVQWGASDQPFNVPVPGDYDGDGKTDIAVWHPGDGTWYIINSSNASTRVVQWGAIGQPFNIPVPADYDGDGMADIAVWHPGDGTWYIINSSNGSTRIVQWGASGQPFNIPVPGDYDGDGRADIAVWHPGDGTWYIINSSDGSTRIVQWGSSPEPFNVPAPADYDGDGKTDIAVWHPGDGTWYIINSSNGSVRTVQWGASGLPYNVPIPGR